MTYERDAAKASKRSSCTGQFNLKVLGAHFFELHIVEASSAAVQQQGVATLFAYCINGH